MTHKSEWQQETRIRSYEAGADGKAGLAIVCNLLQECAAVHADHLGISYELMHERRLAWTLARLGVEIRRRPGVREELSVQTWINGTRGPFAMREFVVLDALSRRIARATYAWLAIETQSKKPVRPSQIVGGYPPPPDRPSLNAPLGKIPDPVDPVSRVSFRVFESDIDMRGHVNNSRYIAWIEDTLVADSKRDGKRPSVTWLHVNFLAEAFAGDTIKARMGTIPGEAGPEGKIVVLSRVEDGVELVRALATLGDYEEPGPSSNPPV